ncbi:Bax inhibitor-1/YccA family protein [Gloeobacter kilaueensis]|uniref:HflBKC-binding inner membrane protein n=1 Tax=Gloeobacter kilaueensis (strain ATCC BAA-2537 / CCAP 1431/1 / ULC 316 / JS1) TaxID=1183438 RepID=U5QES1_GLOK1|nr:Bax inhibitor-1/YccA family protein [Gloeobacter kilaueensis]AGY57343.1 HflBKC-binding inner membrane protein [Gloeobacter kilaueensis JS1]
MYGYSDSTGLNRQRELRASNLPGAFAAMGISLGLTGAISWWASFLPGIAAWFWPLIIVQFGLILAIGTVRSWSKNADNLSLVLLFVYAGVTGLVLAPIASIYLASSVGQGILLKALVSAGATFAAGAIYGWTTKKDLSNWGSILFMALLGIIISSLLNIFLLKSPVTDLVISWITVIVFTAFTAFDLNMARDNRFNQTAGQIALNLYLDFLNLFLAFLRIFGGSSRD